MTVRVTWPEGAEPDEVYLSGPGFYIEADKKGRRHLRHPRGASRPVARDSDCETRESNSLLPSVTLAQERP